MTRLWRWLERLWAWLEDLSTTLKPCRFSVIVLTITTLLLLLVPQCQEALRGLAERYEVAWLFWLQWILFFCAAGSWSVNAWYWARQMLNIQFPDTLAPTRRREVMRNIVPRVLGTVAFLAVTAALWLSGRVYREMTLTPQVAQAHHSLNVCTAIALALSVLFYLFVHYRRRLFKLPPAVRVASRKQLPPTTRVLICACASLAFILFLAFIIAPIRVGALFGAPAILLFAASTWIPFGSICVYVGSRYNFPVLTILFLFTVLFGYWNDNHALRTLPAESSVALSAEMAASDWLRARRQAIDEANGNHRPYPVFVVAAAGGGIRAGYWTASLLAALEDRSRARRGEDFSNHTFAISGVSGGSLGAAVFVAMLAHEQKGHDLPFCQDRPAGPLQRCAIAILSQDFLAPTLGSMLYPDLVQRFFPWPIHRFDRAITLEKSWEQAWADQHFESNPLAEPFIALWSDDKSHQLPFLFLASTVVETGQRAIVTPAGTQGFDDALDVRQFTGAALPLSTATHLSARFTYLSPAASVYDRQGIFRLHLVDGGYFENSGSSTAADVTNALRAAAAAEKVEINIRVILISNEPDYLPNGSTDPQTKPLRFMPEALAPLQALYSAREARGRYAEADIARYTSSLNGSKPILFGLKQHSVPLPLGWMLSDTAQHEIDEQVQAQLSDAAGSVNEIDQLLTGASVGSGK